MRSRDTVARLGGDEFVVIAEDLAGDAVGLFVDRLREAVGQPLTAVPGRLGLSIGAAPIAAGGRTAAREGPGEGIGAAGEPDPAELLRHADAAMYRDKLSRVGPRPARFAEPVGAS